MSDGDDAVDSESATEDSTLLHESRERARQVGRAVFGDRGGLLVWLGLVLALAALWRVGIFLTDTYTIANTVANLADGSLAIEEIEYSLTMGTQPGLHQYDGVLYGRNYGQAALAVPLVWTLEALSAVAEPRFVLLVGWSLGALVFARALGTAVGRRRRFALVGSAVAVLATVVGVAVGTPLAQDSLALVALQLSTVFAAATVGLFAYRLLATVHGRTVGIAAGVAAGLATPIGFWASIPKRHVLVAALLMGAVFAFARARETGSLRLRAAAYVLAGLVAWVHAFEGFFLVVGLGVVDLATARTTGRREIVVVALALSVALAPTLATNAAISGNPMQPPRLLPGVGVGDVELAPDGDARVGDGSEGIRTGPSGEDPLGGGTDGGGSGDGGSGDGGGGDGGGDAGPGDGGPGGGGTDGGVGPIQWLVGLLAGAVAALIGLLPRPPDTALIILDFVIGTIVAGLAALTEPHRLYHVFLRSGNIGGLNYAINGFEVVELTVLESMPLLGALATLPVLAARRVRDRGSSLLSWPRSWTAARQTDLLVGTLAVVFTVIYLSRLPLHSMFTMRYLMPLYPLGLYVVFRLPPVVGAIDGAGRSVARAYAAALLLGGVALGSAILALGPGLGEAVQFHALVHLGAAAALGGVVTARTLLPEIVSRRAVRWTLAATAAVTTVYLALAALAYFTVFGQYAFDVVRVAAEWLGPIV